MGRAHVVVEDRRTALRESGDVVLAVREGTLSEQSLIPLADVVAGRWNPSSDRPIVFKSSGMSWEDLIIARTLVDRVG
jgi:ornithine cyclodeaminase/alanine dehydrogenase-like protein (mu-crystallin family)